MEKSNLTTQTTSEMTINLNQLFGDAILNMYIVSNTQFLDTDQVDKIPACPGRFLEAVREALSAADIDPVFTLSFNNLKDYCECEASSLFNTLRKVDIIIGPNRESFETDIAHQHVASVEGCERCTVPTVKAITEDLISKILGASSLRVDNPDVHLHTYFSRDEINPRLLSKRILIEDAKSIIKKHTSSHFIYPESSGSLVVTEGNRDLTIMEKKLAKGGLSDHIITMQRKALATEKRLLEAPPEKLMELIDQLESVVQSECDEALLEAKYSDGPMGEMMLLYVRRRLRQIVENNPRYVLNEPYDTLIGFAGLLTSDCKVWWSEKFDID